MMWILFVKIWILYANYFWFKESRRNSNQTNSKANEERIDTQTHWYKNVLSIHACIDESGCDDYKLFLMGKETLERKHGGDCLA